MSTSIIYSFKNDYSEAMHPRILNAISQDILVQEEAYGNDSECLAAKHLILERINNPKAEVHFVVGSTLANLLIISSILKPFESVIASEHSHIHIHEAGAIEGTGHKINIAKSNDGKLSISEIDRILTEHHFEHMTSPRLVCISNSTELGTVYSKTELKDIARYCKSKDLLLFVDGARLAQALSSPIAQMSLEEFSSFVDVYVIGGTKNGGVLGEAIVITNPNIQYKFRYHMKHRGALLAKSRIIGTQFKEFFKDELYILLATHAHNMAHKLANAIIEQGYSLFYPQESNMVFPIFPNQLISHLEKSYSFYIWSICDESNSVLRLVCSWATQDIHIDSFVENLTKFKY